MTLVACYVTSEMSLSDLPLWRHWLTVNDQQMNAGVAAPLNPYTEGTI